MKKVTSTVKIYKSKIKLLTDAQIRALEQTAEHLKTEVMMAQVIPYDQSDLQKSAFVDDSNKKNGTVELVYSTPYARRLYYHPEYNFNQDPRKNPNAQGKWCEPWLTGNNKDWCQKEYAKLYKQLGGV